jgi:2-iminobutanoate/2-iminopropanoate deaminase
MEKTNGIPAGTPAPAPYSPSLLAGPFVFISGQVGVDPQSGELSGSDVGSQTRQILANIQALLARAGLGLSDVVKTTVFLTRMEDFHAMNKTYGQFFTDPLPTRSTVGVAALPRPDCLVEIEAVALAGGAR